MPSLSRAGLDILSLAALIILLGVASSAKTLIKLFVWMIGSWPIATTLVKVTIRLAPGKVLYNLW
jgi:hypothetical protein